MAVLPVALDSTRERWQTVDNFAFWYLCLERFFVKHGFASRARVKTPHPLNLNRNPSRLSWPLAQPLTPTPAPTPTPTLMKVRRRDTGRDP